MYFIITGAPNNKNLHSNRPENNLNSRLGETELEHEKSIPYFENDNEETRLHEDDLNNGPSEIESAESYPYIGHDDFQNRLHKNNLISRFRELGFQKRVPKNYNIPDHDLDSRLGESEFEWDEDEMYYRRPSEAELYNRSKEAELKNVSNDNMQSRPYRFG